MAEARTPSTWTSSAPKERYSPGWPRWCSHPGSEGELGITPRHAPLLTLLKAGEVRVKTADSEHSIYIGGGALEVQPNKVDDSRGHRAARQGS